MALDLAISRLTGVDGSGPVDLDRHLQLHGDLPAISAADVLGAVDAAGITGRGGAAFPVGKKLSAVAAESGPAVVIGNGAEGEPAASKDRWLLTNTPHLVLDGLQLAARAVGATAGYLYVAPDPAVRAVMDGAIVERQRRGSDLLPVQIVVAPDSFIAGEESAVVSRVETGVALPRVKPPRVTTAGAWGRPTLVQNVESLAQVALIARHGARWFRTLGTATEPGTMLFSVSGAVGRPAVLEAAIGTPVVELIESAGGLTEPVQALLFGGYHGAWMQWEIARGLRLCNADLRPQGAALGAGVIVALSERRCGLVESARVIDYLASESAGQCGPCLHGLPRLAEQFALLARPRRHGCAPERIMALANALERRGACSHPDGSLRFARSALSVFGTELRLHAKRQCSASGSEPVLPTRAPGLVGL